MNTPGWALSPILFAAILAAGAATLQPPTRPLPAGLPPAAAKSAPLPRKELETLLAGAYAGDEFYAAVSSTWMQNFYTDFRREIFSKGVTRWDERFDCNHFAGYYVALAQTKFYLDNFQSKTAANTLALGVCWYRQDGSTSAAHAIVVAVTELGVRFLDPQTGFFIGLSAHERSTIFLVLF